MKNFLLGLITGALGTYAAIKLSDEEARAELSKKLSECKDKAQALFEQGKSCGKEHLSQFTDSAKEQYEQGKKTISQKTANVAGKLIDVLETVETKAEANSK